MVSPRGYDIAPSCLLLYIFNLSQQGCKKAAPHIFLYIAPFPVMQVTCDPSNTVPEHVVLALFIETALLHRCGILGTGIKSNFPPSPQLLAHRQAQNMCSGNVTDLAAVHIPRELQGFNTGLWYLGGRVSQNKRRSIWRPV